jgi:hypothetical protein
MSPWFIETHGIMSRNPLAKKRPAINSRKNGKDEYVTNYVVEHAPKQ